MAYSYYRTITVDHTKCGSSNSSSFPILVSLNHTTMKSVANSGHIQNSTTQASPAVTMPADLIFTSDSVGNTKIPWEVEFWDASNGLLICWVQLASVSYTADTTFYMFYGDSGVTTAQNTGSYTPQNVWDTNYKGVWHLPDGTTLTKNDSTSSGNTLSNGTASAATGKVGGGAGFNGTSNYLYSSDDASLLINLPVTLECWYKRNVSTGAGLLFGISSLAGGGGVGIGVGNVGGYYSNNSIVISKPNINNTSVAVAPLDTNWHHLVVTIDTINGELVYVDGAYVGLDTNKGGLFGGYNRGAYTGSWGYYISSYLNGSTDELRVSNIVRTADWVTTEYNNQNAPGNIGSANFLTFGTESSSGGETITIDKWLGLGIDLFKVKNEIISYFKELETNGQKLLSFCRQCCSAK